MYKIPSLPPRGGKEIKDPRGGEWKEKGKGKEKKKEKEKEKGKKKVKEKGLTAEKGNSGKV